MPWAFSSRLLSGVGQGSAAELQLPRWIRNLGFLIMKLMMLWRLEFEVVVDQDACSVEAVHKGALLDNCADAWRAAHFCLDKWSLAWSLLYSLFRGIDEFLDQLTWTSKLRISCAFVVRLHTMHRCTAHFLDRNSSAGNCALLAIILHLLNCSIEARCVAIFHTKHETVLLRKTRCLLPWVAHDVSLHNLRTRHKDKQRNAMSIPAE